MELPKTPSDSSPGTLPLWGASFSPPLGPDPGGFSHAGPSRGQVSATCSRAREPGASSARVGACAQGPMESRVSNASCENGGCRRGAEAGDVPGGVWGGNRGPAFLPHRSFHSHPLLPGGPKPRGGGGGGGSGELELFPIPFSGLCWEGAGFWPTSPILGAG